MKVLFDHNVSHRLVVRLADLIPQSTHVKSLGLETADDQTIWEYAAAHEFVIATQDSDFVDWQKVLGSPRNSYGCDVGI